MEKGRFILFPSFFCAVLTRGYYDARAARSKNESGICHVMLQGIDSRSIILYERDSK